MITAYSKKRYLMLSVIVAILIILLGCFHLFSGYNHQVTVKIDNSNITSDGIIVKSVYTMKEWYLVIPVRNILSNDNNLNLNNKVKIECTKSQLDIIFSLKDGTYDLYYKNSILNKHKGTLKDIRRHVSFSDIIM